MTTMRESEFDTKFTMKDGKDGSTVMEWEEVKDLDPKYVWTWVDGDRGETCLVTGIHYVNRFGYGVTEEPHNDEDLCVVMEFPEPPTTCKWCSEEIESDGKGSWVDATDGDGCDDNDRKGVHEPYVECYGCGTCDNCRPDDVYLSGSGELMHDQGYIDYLNRN